ncbi:MAG: HEAT repeat domain-containing protein [Planctomycetales bacterium]|nr:HEAT repeat domain-containing protein [Planctomycetales bacterium]
MSLKSLVKVWLGVPAIITCLMLCQTWADDTETESGDGKSAADQPVAASDEGELAIGSFSKPAGWNISLFAAEPHLANPVAMYVDNSGRVFVCESFRQDRGVTDNRAHDREWLLADLAAQSVQDRIDYHIRLLGSEASEYTAHDDRIRMIVDTDADGKADSSTVFAEGFNKIEDGTGAGILVRGNSAFYTCIPKLWKLSDTNGDGVAEQRDILQDGYGVRVAFRGHDSHGLIIGPDGRLYFSIGDRGYNIETAAGQFKNVESGAVFRCELDGSNLEVFATGLRNPQELAFDDYGYLFTGDNNSDSGDRARWVNVMEGGDTGWRMMYQYLPDRGPFNREKIWHPFSADTPAYIVPPIENIGDGPSGLSCYPGTGLSGDFANCFFMVDFRGGAANSGIRLIRVTPKGAFWKVERSEQPIWNILATDADFGPDGALWVCDWVNGWVGEGKGRIYRFTDSVAQKQDIVKEVADLLKSGFESRSVVELQNLLNHLDRRVRLEAQWELAHRGVTAPFLSVLSNRGLGTIARLHALWGLGHTARIHPETRDAIVDEIGTALVDEDLDVRRVAAGIVGDLRLEQLSQKIVSLIGDTEPRVQYAACLAAGKMQLASAIDPVCQLLATADNSDPGLRHAGIMALAGQADLQSIVALKSNTSEAVRIAAVVALRKRQHLGIAEYLADNSTAIRLEAARAIHDVPELHAVLDRVADTGILEGDSDALIHRILNANFRHGGAQAARLVANFAAHPDHSDLMRVEALNMLATWAQPGKLDRVMNRFMPLDDRSADDAKRALEAVVSSAFIGSLDVQRAAIESATELGISNVNATLKQMAMDVGSDEQLRLDALRGLAKLDSAGIGTVLAALSADASPAIRGEVLELIVETSPENALPAIRRALESKESIERQAAWDAAAKVETSEVTALIEHGLKDYIQGTLPPDVWLNVIEAAEGRVSAESITALNKFEAEMSAADPLDAYRDCAFGGDPRNGRSLFFTKTELSCVRCHKVGETGGEVGPILTEIGKTKDNRYLLESIVLPDAKIAENFETVLLLTEDDQIISGILRKETPSMIELINAEGKILEIDPLDVVSRRKGKSAMPVDLIKHMTRRELRDVVAFLSELKGEQSLRRGGRRRNSE